MGEKALIAMSGGVDSSVAAWLMREAGHNCIGVTLKLFSAGETEAAGSGRDLRTASHKACCSGAATRKSCCSLADVNDARDVAYRLGMPHYVLNFAGEFRDQVIRRFIETYEGGGTPNPCIDCNRYIKFQGLFRRMEELGFGLIVTGHYARIEKAGDRWLLKKGLDAKKDQSYVLYCLTQEQLARTCLPLGSLTKARVREIAGERGFINAEKADSQDICFVPDGDYGCFMEEYTGKRYPPGDILDGEGRVIGKHRGLVRYTLGQRRGLGVAANEPLYVAAKDPAANTLTLGRDASLYARSLIAGEVNLISLDRLDRPLRVKARTRYLQTEQWASAQQLEDGTLRLDFDEPQRALTPGQAAVLYDGDLVVGGGTILRAF